MITQYYSIKVADPDRVEPGQFIFSSNEHDEVIGFIYKVDGPIAEFVMFEPQEISDTVTLTPLVMTTHWAEMLNSIKDLMSPEQRDAWAEALEP
jgi:hypothetical protein